MRCSVNFLNDQGCDVRTLTSVRSTKLSLRKLLNSWKFSSVGR